MDNWKNAITSKKGIILIITFILFVLGIYFYGSYAGLFLMFSLIVFGAFSFFWKEKEIKILTLVLMVLLSLINIGINPMKYGIDFSGGTRIPVILEHPVDSATMEELVDIIKKRASVLGLSEVKVSAIGDSEINIEVPSDNQEQILFIEEVLSKQGIYEGIVDGKVAITGDDILPGSVGSLSSQYLSDSADWGVSFSITSKSAKSFSEIVYGKANYPLYMFLDRPTNAIIILSKDELSINSPEGYSIDDLYDACNDAIKNEKNDLRLYLLEEIDLNSSIDRFDNKTKAIISEGSPQWIIDYLSKNNFTIVYVSKEQISPTFTKGMSLPSISDWDGIGLLSAPRLSKSITEGSISTFYSISGPAQGEGNEKIKDAQENVKRITSVLKGGALPVKITLGAKTVLPPQLGIEFLRLSLIGIAVSLLVISLMIGLRYMKKKLVIPIILISISELIILLSILGSFTIDLAAMAGIIAAIGVGVDAQIVITDEILKKQSIELSEKLENAFTIIKTTVIVSIVAMLPLLFSGMTEIIGFALSTILGALLGYLISRPAYAAIVKNIAEH